MKRIIVLSIIAILVSLFSYVSLKHVMMCDELYKDSKLLDKEENKEIKSLLLNVMKDRHSTINVNNNHKLYTRDLYMRRVQNFNRDVEKSTIVVVNHNFMDSVTKTGENHYDAIVLLIWPYYWECWEYHFWITREDGHYRVSDFGLG